MTCNPGSSPSFCEFQIGLLAGPRITGDIHSILLILVSFVKGFMFCILVGLY